MHSRKSYVFWRKINLPKLKKKVQRDLTSLQGKRDNLRADVDRLHFERIESLDRETVLNIKIQDLSNGHAYKKEIQGKKYYNSHNDYGQYRQ